MEEGLEAAQEACRVEVVTDIEDRATRLKRLMEQDAIYQSVLDGTYCGVVDGGLDENYPADSDVVEVRTTYTELRKSAEEYLAKFPYTGRKVAEKKDVGPRLVIRGRGFMERE